MNTHTGIVLHRERMQAGWIDGRTLLMDEAMTAPCAAAPATLLVVDETHTFSAGPGGCWGRYARTRSITSGKTGCRTGAPSKR